MSIAYIYQEANIRPQLGKNPFPYIIAAMKKPCLLFILTGGLLIVGA